MMGRWTATISDTLVNDAAFQYSNNRIVITPGGTNPGLLPQVSAAIPTLYSNSIKQSPIGVPQVNLGSYGSGNTLSNIAPWQNQLDLYSFQDNASKIFGRNVLKFGLNVDWDGKDEDTGPASSERPSVSTGDTNVAIASAGGFTTGNNLANFLIPGNVFNISETSTNVRAQLRWRNYEFYATDNFKLTPRLTIDAGLRYSIMPPTYQPNVWRPTSSLASTMLLCHRRTLQRPAHHSGQGSLRRCEQAVRNELLLGNSGFEQVPPERQLSPLRSARRRELGRFRNRQNDRECRRWAVLPA